MTAANVILIYQEQYHLFSVGSDGYPDSIDRIVACCEELIQHEPNEAPDGVSEYVLRTDSTYVYLMDFDSKQARCWRNRHYHGGETLSVLIGQTKHEVDLSEFKKQLPQRWQIINKSHTQFKKQPVEHVKRMASSWDTSWDRLDSLGHQMPQLDKSQLTDRIRTEFPLVPLALPYSKPEHWQNKKVIFLTREGIWIEISAAPWQLECIRYEQLALADTDRFFSTWLLSA